jgi:RNA polymerase sigma-70 factor (ECF subfamily)
MYAGTTMDSPPSTGCGHFATTRWSVVLAAGRADTAHARQALDDLCRVYWPPLYGFVRRRGHSPQDAQDLTQEFFARLLAGRGLGRVDPAKGRFRSFLLASMQHFLANQWDRAHALKRGGGVAPVSIDATTAEASYAREPADTLTPERLFERRWALALLDDVLGRLQRDYAAGGKRALFDELKGTLSGEQPASTYAAIGVRLRLSEGAVKVAAHRLRARYRERLRAEVARTVATPGEVDDELRFLLAALGT